eukprot:Rhum_TRINITY_DN4621_c0_g1::Rhum_TRINITY_DN4621_c0_g1_i1::g.15091::m.15091
MDEEAAARLHRDNEKLATELAEVRALSVHLTKTVKSLREERTTIEDELHATKSRLSSKDLLLQEALHGVTNAHGVLRGSNHTVQDLVKRLPLGSEESPPASPRSCTSPGASIDVQQASATQDALSALSFEVTQASMLSRQLVSIERVRQQPQSMQLRALEQRVQFLKSKLEQTPKYEMEAVRLRRVLNAKQKAEGVVSVSSHADTESNSPEAPKLSPRSSSPPRELANVSCSPPTVIRMPGCTVNNVNPTKEPIRSFGVQCNLIDAPGGFRAPDRWEDSFNHEGREPSIDGREFRSSSPTFEVMRSVSAAVGSGGVRRAVSPGRPSAGQARRESSVGATRRDSSVGAAAARRENSVGATTARRENSVGATTGGRRDSSVGALRRDSSLGPARTRDGSLSAPLVRRRAPSPAASVPTPGLQQHQPRSPRHSTPLGMPAVRRSVTPTLHTRGRSSSRASAGASSASASPMQPSRVRPLSPRGSRPLSPRGRPDPWGAASGAHKAAVSGGGRSVTPRSTPLSPQSYRPRA